MGRYSQKRPRNDRLLKKRGLAATVILDLNAVISFFRTSFVWWWNGRGHRERQIQPRNESCAGPLSVIGPNADGRCLRGLNAH